ncbi:general substrate transporter [Aspergillus venezuelensis]
MEFAKKIWRLRVPKSSKIVNGLLLACSTITSTPVFMANRAGHFVQTIGFDGSMMNGLNILPSYTEYFEITTVTTGLSTSATFIGGVLAGFLFPFVAERLSRRTAQLLAAIITLAFIALQTASQNIAMFIVSRIGVGFGQGCTMVVGPMYLAETFHEKYRGWGLGVVNDCYYVGALIAAGVTYRTAEFDSAWSWRLPSLLQGFWSVPCILILPFVPESPRWLISRGRNEEALRVIAQVTADGNELDPEVWANFQQIVEGMEFEQSTIGRMPLNCALATVIVGNQIASYYFGTMLDNAGITDSTTQLQINIILNAWCLLCSFFGTYIADRLGRRMLALLGTILLTIFLFLIGILIKLYGTSTNVSGIYGTVACMFLFMGSYSIAWTPLTYIYPPEVLNYPIRAQGMGLNAWVYFGFGLVFVFALPFALESMGWKT